MTTKRENIACRPGTTDAMQRLADENEALRSMVEWFREALWNELNDRINFDAGYLTEVFQEESSAALNETPAQSVAYIRAAGAREALERAMQSPGFSDTVIRVDQLRAIIERMESEA